LNYFSDIGKTLIEQRETVSKKSFKEETQLKIDLMKAKYWLSFISLDFLYPVYKKVIKDYYERRSN